MSWPLETFPTTIFLVEQNAFMALKLAHRAYVLENGAITMEGKASDLLHDENVKKAYLGIWRFWIINLGNTPVISVFKNIHIILNITFFKKI